MTDTDARLDRLESLVDRQAETIEALCEQVAKMDGDGSAQDDGSRPSISRRTALKAGGLAGLLALGTGAASADPQGQVGTAGDPLSTLYAEELNGGITGGEAVTDLLGDGLVVDGGGLSVAVGEGLSISNGVLTTLNLSLAPTDLDEVLGGMDRDDDGTYVITNVHELQAIDADLSADYRLGRDIEASYTATWHGGDGFEPIGEVGLDPLQSVPFEGTFAGGGHVVRGLSIDRDDEVAVGLFSTTSGTVANVGLVDAALTGGNIGGIAATNSGSISASYVTGSVAGGGSVGGLLGSNVGVLSESYSSTTVTSDQYAGGLVGTNNGTVRQSYATGSVSGDDRAGGLLGRNYETIEAAYAAAEVTGSANVGGVVGWVGLSTETDLYWDTTLSSGLDAVGGHASAHGEPDADATGLPTTDMVGTAAETNLAGFDFTGTWATVTGPDDYPLLQAIDEQAQLEARG